jgi:D-alanyl-lipoteichoic acid acyltransferase DltB (MBOAT superfamily)
LLIFSTALDYFSGIKLSQARTKKIWLTTSILVNLGLLGTFKYYNFFSNSFSELLSLVGFQLNPSSLNIILPIGISFYTFHGLSYIFDIYRGKIKPEQSFIDYAVFVCYFPLLVAGPIERATHLLPQIKLKRSFNYSVAVDGLKQILWGLFKKVVIADNCAEYVNIIFNESIEFSGSTRILGAFLFSFQIYGDFSGYSDMAIGISKLFGIELLRNFAYPYFSRDIAEFWRRWHISLSRWFKDYLYIPLGGSQGKTIIKIRNIFIIFLVSGFWHGANWTFIAWGALNAIYFLPILLLKRNRINLKIVAPNKYLPSISELGNILITFILTSLAWILFRANNLEQAITYYLSLFSLSMFSVPEILPVKAIITIVIFIILEWIGREHAYAIAKFGNHWNRYARWTFYYIIILIIIYYNGKEQQFIYFQF